MQKNHQRDLPVTFRWFAFVVLFGCLSVGCGGDDGTEVQGGRNQVATASQDYSWIDINFTGYAAGAFLELRAGHGSSAELNTDPQATVATLAPTTYRVAFNNLSAASFVASDARILLVLKSSIGDELQGVVVLCNSAGPIVISPECKGDCAPLCCLPGHDCDG